LFTAEVSGVFITRRRGFSFVLRGAFWRFMARFFAALRMTRAAREGLEDVNEAFRAMKAGEVARTVLMFE